MATNDPKSRLTEGNLSSPYTSPNGVTEQGTSGRSPAPATTPDPVVEVRGESRPDASAGEKIGRFFRRAMERIAGTDDESWREESDRALRDREVQERPRSEDRSWQSGRSALQQRGRSEWSNLGRSRDDRSQSDRAGPSSDLTGSHQRLQSSEQGSGSVGHAGPYGQGQGRHGQPSFGQGAEEQLGQRAPGKTPGRGDWSDPAGRDWRGQERWGERSVQGGATGMSARYAASGASFGFASDEQRGDEWGEMARDRDQGQGRRFWQREPLSARDVMTRNPRAVTRQSPIREAALVMREENCGVVPVVDGAGRLEGILTDRDIVVRGLIDEGTLRRIEEVMTDDVSAVTEDEPLTSVLDLMGRKQIRRVPVVDRNDRLLGIISMADIANRADYDEDLQDAFERISSRRSFWSLFS